MFAKTASALLAAALVATPALAADERNDPARGPAAAADAAGATAKAAPRNLSAKRAIAANVGSARFALHFDYEKGITRQKGVYSVRNPAEGLYCIRLLKITASQQDALVPSVTVDYSASTPEVMLAYYRSTASKCRTSEFGVYTLALVNGAFELSDNVGFTLVAN